MKSSLKLTIFAAAMLPAFASAATTYVYDVATNVGAANTLLSTDGWVGDDLPNWIVGNFNGNLYARNSNDGDNTITRANNGEFSYSIPANATTIILEMDVRAGTGFWQAGISNGTTNVLGIGSDWGATLNKFFILDGDTRRFETGANATTDSYNTLRLEFDLVNGTADLILNPSGSNTILINDLALTTTGTTLAGANSLFIRTDSRYAGPAEFRITAVPEPSAALLGGLGVLALLRRRRA